MFSFKKGDKNIKISNNNFAANNTELDKVGMI